MPEAARVRAMFDAIAPRYDLLNLVLSLGIDRRWRRRVARVLAEGGCHRVLDVCCGTGDSTFALRQAGIAATGIDFAGNMLSRATAKSQGTLFMRGDAQRLPFKDATFDGATIAFGLRNLEDRERGLAELARVVRPGGLVAVLEFTLPPRQPWRAVYLGYFLHVLPLVGRLFGHAEAYRYLPNTVLAWPSPQELEREMASTGLTACRHESMTMGIAALHVGVVPERGPT